MADGLVSRLQTMTGRTLHRLGGVPDWQVMLLLVAATIGLRLLCFEIYGYPISHPADGKANILGAVTFAEGRITNPANPWEPFMLFVLDSPTRMMKYQPAMAGFMAVGIVLFGHMHWGVVGGIALSIAASYWCLAGWVSRRMALAGAVILMLMLRAPHYWIWDYWGGMHILLASLLMVGAYPRVILQHRYHYIIPGALGFVLALLGRPFEGVVLAASLTICGFATLMLRFSAGQRDKFLQAIWLPALLILSCYAAFQMVYNYRITGDALKLPYMLYHEKFESAPMFTFGEPTPRDLDGMKAMHDFQFYKDLNPTDRRVENTLDMWMELLGLADARQYFMDRHLEYAVGAFFHLPLLYMLIACLRRREVRPRMVPLLVATVCSCAAFEVIYWSFPHYMVPYFVAIAVSFFVVWDELELPPLFSTAIAFLCMALFISAGGQIFP